MVDSTAANPAWPQPSHPTLINVVKSSTAFSSYAISLVSRPAGNHFARITKHYVVPSRTFATVETPNGRHIDLNSDLFYINHSCNPSLEFDMALMEVRVSRYRELRKGDVLTFFYPSTESFLAQPFKCFCGEATCKGTIQGAEQMGAAQLTGYWLNQHVENRLEEKIASSSSSTGENIDEKCK